MPWNHGIKQGGHHHSISGRSPEFTLQPPVRLHFSNSTGGVLNCAGTSGAATPGVVTWTTGDGRPVQPVSRLIVHKIP